MSQSQGDDFLLHQAARDGRVVLVESLLKSNSGLSLKKDNDGRLPIHWAVSSNNLEIVKQLVQLSGFDPDVQDDSGWTPLMIAVNIADSDEIISLLLQKGADINMKNFAGQSIMHFIASKKKVDLARMFLALKPPASVRIRDKRGQYPIHRAASIGSVPMIEALLKAHSPLNASDISGSTALHHSISEGHGDVAVALLKAGIDAKRKDSDGNLALDVAPDNEVRKYIIKTAEAEGIDLN
ncbi:Ankyrin repeat-containing protein C6C3.08 [Ceratocystis fimbriata CBS 114723]|uniref:Ankyrin repeat-containing protein C6C3.08 n=2 Tax=Ceratocystis TaxID=5157 RepID=A0A2C5X0Y8_9PEZI|nr:Ankyrin repeat-containing protein C6C3.08 [Ceratocystis fimbriata CBS 114723]